MPIIESKNENANHFQNYQFLEMDIADSDFTSQQGRQREKEATIEQSGAADSFSMSFFLAIFYVESARSRPSQKQCETAMSMRLDT